MGYHFFLFVLLVVWRCPELIKHPRFWAEEGKNFYSFAYNHSWLETLSYVQFGYYNLTNNLAALLATQVPLEQAPLVTTIFCILILCLLCLICLHGPFIFELDKKQRWLIALGALLVQPSSEIWLNSINLQSYWAVIGFLILLLDFKKLSARQKIFYWALLLFGALSGPNVVLLLPLFIFRASKHRSKDNLASALIIALSFALQLSCYLQLRAQHASEVIDRTSFTMSPEIFLGVIIAKQVILPLGGLRAANEWGFFFQASQGQPWLLSLCLFLSFIFLAAYFVRADFKKFVLIFGAYLITSFVSIFMGRGDKAEYINAWGGGRYFYTINFIFFAYLVFSLNDFKNFRKIILKLSLFCFLGWGIYYYKKAVYIEETWPSWSLEVEKWRKDSSYQLQIWPPGWSMSLEVQK